ncbi:hypothetical protein NP572_05755 [Pseudomonas putida]|uniref:hypothetical protein n=1 Tax=Pseudomonas putida TaxID=303 RepID=UPI0023636BCC|nr:hypothetical protein [Pseudomonas putida]MDD2035922.1 hypothetical protein [Pseudomonas putida]MDD2041643.1 hypothetical protein [Pseudomonas putida]
MIKQAVVAIDPASKRCVRIGDAGPEYLKDLFDLGLILVPAKHSEAVKALHETHPDLFRINSEPSAHSYPDITPPGLSGRIEAAFVSIAHQGDIGLATRLKLMHPSTEVDRESCAKYATVVLSRLVAALLATLPLEQSDRIQQELAEYLSSNFECP